MSGPRLWRRAPGGPPARRARSTGARSTRGAATSTNRSRRRLGRLPGWRGTRARGRTGTGRPCARRARSSGPSAASAATREAGRPPRAGRAPRRGRCGPIHRTPGGPPCPRRDSRAGATHSRIVRRRAGRDPTGSGSHRTRRTRRPGPTNGRPGCCRSVPGHPAARPWGVRQVRRRSTRARAPASRRASSGMDYRPRLPRATRTEGATRVLGRTASPPR